jgi:hypothetical protein
MIFFLLSSHFSPKVTANQKEKISKIDKDVEEILLFLAELSPSIEQKNLRDGFNYDLELRKKDEQLTQFLLQLDSLVGNPEIRDLRKGEVVKIQAIQKKIDHLRSLL